MINHPFLRKLAEGVAVGLDRRGDVCVFIAESDETANERVCLPIAPFDAFADGYGKTEAVGITISRSTADPHEALLSVTHLGNGLAFERAVGLETIEGIVKAGDDLELAIELFAVLGIQESDGLHVDVDDMISTHQSRRTRSRAA